MYGESDFKKKSTRLSLPELAIVLSVTLVLAAILMPAIASTDPDRAESILSSTTTAGVFDGLVQSVPDNERLDRISRREERRMLSAARSHISPQDESSMLDTERSAKVVGIEQLITTDIRYRQP